MTVASFSAVPVAAHFKSGSQLHVYTCVQCQSFPTSLLSRSSRRLVRFGAPSPVASSAPVSKATRMPIQHRMRKQGRLLRGKSRTRFCITEACVETFMHPLKHYCVYIYVYMYKDTCMHEHELYKCIYVYIYVDACMHIYLYIIYIHMHIHVGPVYP